MRLPRTGPSDSHQLYLDKLPHARLASSVRVRVPRSETYTQTHTLKHTEREGYARRQIERESERSFTDNQEVTEGR